jgi:hypothetical protein
VRDVKMLEVRHRSRATSSRQPRQVRKEATVTGSCVCSGVPVPGLISFFPSNLLPQEAAAERPYLILAPRFARLYKREPE